MKNWVFALTLAGLAWATSSDALEMGSKKALKFGKDSRVIFYSDSNDPQPKRPGTVTFRIVLDDSRQNFNITHIDEVLIVARLEKAEADGTYIPRLRKLTSFRAIYRMPGSPVRSERVTLSIPTKYSLDDLKLTFYAVKNLVMSDADLPQERVVDLSGTLTGGDLADLEATQVTEVIRP